MLAVITVLVVVMAVMAALSRGSQFTTSSTSPSSPAGGNTATQKTPYAGLNITYMFVDVLSGSFRPPSSNTTTINKDKTTYTASVGATFTVEVHIEYMDCHGSSCPSEISSVRVAPASFAVRAITVMPPNSGAGLPALVSLTSGANEDCKFSVTITAPPTPYTGPLTLTAQTG